MRLLTVRLTGITTTEQVSTGLPLLTKRADSPGPSKPSSAIGFGLNEFPPLEPPQKPIPLSSPKIVTPVIPLISRFDATKSNLSTSKLASTLADVDATASTKAPVEKHDTVPVAHVRVEITPESNIKAPEIATSSNGSSKAKVISAAKELKTVVQSFSTTQSESVSSSRTSLEPTNGERRSEASTDISNKKHMISQHPPPVRNLRTLRLITTVKAEDTHPVSSEIESAITSNDIGLSKFAGQHSGHASSKQPSTPINELISESVSLTSASASRPGTPNLSSRIHTGPTIIKSKNQIKKERQARAKQTEELRSEEVSVVDEEIQAPVLGRKKKAKKIAFTKPKSVVKVPLAGVETATDDGVTEESGPIIGNRTSASSAAHKDPVPAKEPQHPMKEESIDIKQASSRPAITAASILADLKNEGILNLADIEYYLNPSGLNTRLDVNTNNIFKYQASLDLDEEETEILDSGDSIAKQINPDEWAVILPDRSVLRHFTKDEACHYVDLKLELDQNFNDTFNGHDFPIDAWSSFTSNDVLSSLQIAPPFDGTYHNRPFTIFDTPEPLIEEFTATLLRPDGKDVSYGAMYPPRTQTENEEIETRMAMYTLEEAEQTVKASEELLLGVRKETEQLEKKLSALVKKNRKALKDWC